MCYDSMIETNEINWRQAVFLIFRRLVPCSDLLLSIILHDNRFYYLCEKVREALERSFTLKELEKN